jgi:hypothetical protein
MSAAWSPDGTRIVTASADHTALIWATDGTPLGTLKGPPGRVNLAEWSPLAQYRDGSTLVVTASEDQTARIWQVYITTEALVDAAIARVTRCLTQAQRKDYFLPPAPPTWCVERRLWPYHGDEWQAWLPKQKAWLASGRRGEAPALPQTH